MTIYEDDSEIRGKLAQGALRHTFLDPAETWGSWMHLVVRHPTGVAYQQQCGGMACHQHYVEGYLVPLPQPTVGKNLPSQLTELFHRKGVCFGYDYVMTPEDRQRMEELLSRIHFWKEEKDGHDYAAPLQLDTDRILEVEEGWIPVLTPDGPAVLVFQNCD